MHNLHLYFPVYKNLKNSSFGWLLAPPVYSFRFLSCSHEATRGLDGPSKFCVDSLSRYLRDERTDKIGSSLKRVGRMSFQTTFMKIGGVTQERWSFHSPKSAREILRFDRVISNVYELSKQKIICVLLTGCYLRPSTDRLCGGLIRKRQFKPTICQTVQQMNDREAKTRLEPATIDEPISQTQTVTQLVISGAEDRSDSTLAA